MDCGQKFYQNPDQNGFLVNPNPIFPLLLYRKPNFLIFVRAHVIMTSQKPNAGHVGNYFGINV